MKTKTIFLSLFFMLASIGLWAQNAYEFAVLRRTGFSIYMITENNKEQLKMEKGQELETFHLKKLSEVVAQGWELFATTTDEGGISYHLRKKKN